MTIILPDPKKCSKCGSTNSRPFSTEFVEGVECRSCGHRAPLRWNKKDPSPPVNEKNTWAGEERTF